MSLVHEEDVVAHRETRVLLERRKSSYSTPGASILFHVVPPPGPGCADAPETCGTTSHAAEVDPQLCSLVLDVY